MNNDFQKHLSRRQRQILDILYEVGEASVLEIQDRLPKAPTPMAIRRMLQILEEDKGLVKRRKEGRNYIYTARPARGKTGAKMLNHVVKTFFDGSFSRALAAHLADRKTTLSREDYAELMDAIKQANE
jgi:BlaI family penicillinase repressor